MLWNKRRPGGRPPHPSLPLALAAALFLAIAVCVFSSLIRSAAAAASAESEKHLSIYSAVANYSLPVRARNSQDYVDLLEVLDPLGKVTAKTEGKRWKVRYQEQDVEFTDGKKNVRWLGSGFDLPANFLLEGGHGMVPLSSLPQLLSRILGGPVTWHENSRRLFIGNVAVHFTAQVRQQANPTLVINFTAPVNPAIATESGKLHMQFSREALVAPGSPVLTFDSKVISSANYEENNGSAEITVNGNAPLFAAFSDDRKTIIVTAAQQTKTPAPTAPTPAGSGVATSVAGPAGTNSSNGASPPPAGSSPEAPAPTPLEGLRKYFAVVDASHGGDERGAALDEHWAEKDVTLAIARELRQQLENRGITTLLLRDGDVNLTVDQRASQTNTAHPAVYLCIHAASEGTGVRLYTALVPAAGEAHGPFVSWDTAQSGFVAASQATAASVAVDLRSKAISVRTLAAPLRPLNNIHSAALALEIAPPDGRISELSSPDYQLLVASSVAAAIAAARASLEAAP
jgi:N-acetylmuramoyl-L-alanine amidase